MQPATAARGASAEAIQRHYDLSNDFYRLWLDPELIYSAAMWGEGDDLAAAQRRKLDYHIATARAAGKARVLDIGCGWGSLLKRLVQNAGVARAVGLTLSEAQAGHVRGFAVPGVEVHVQSWADHTPESPYDAIVSIGAFEHFARIEFTEEQKVNAYREFFEACHGFLRPGGYLSLQTFAYNGRRPRAAAVDSEATRFLASEIFPETDPPRTANICEAIEGTFEIVTLRNDRADYGRTCRVWNDNLKANREAARKLVGQAALDRYERYLTYSYLGFMGANLALYRIGLRRIDSWRAR